MRLFNSLRHPALHPSLLLGATVLLGIGLTACGGSEPEPPAPPAPPVETTATTPPPESPSPQPEEADIEESAGIPEGADSEEAPSEEAALPQSTDFAGVRGTANFDGERPRRRIIRMSADPGCEAIHGSNPVGTEDAIVRSDGSIKNVFVYVKNGAELGGPGHSVPAKLDQVGCTYKPHILGVQVNQPIDIVNSDNVAHNVHAQPKINQSFNFGQPGPGTRQQTFRRAEMAIPIKCDIHPWMISYTFVMDHPYYALTGDDGSFSIPDLPAGQHTLVAWHETFGEREAAVTVSPNAGATVEFVFTP
jgi:plastocyanin